MKKYFKNLNFNKLQRYLKKETIILLCAVMLGFIFTVTITTVTKGYSYKIQKGISDEVIRLHVLANSDTKEDQDLKIKVKNGITKMLSKELNKSHSKAETRELLIKNIDKIKKTAEKIIKENGYKYNISAELDFEMFPTKSYGDITLPAGKYEALKIKIGEAKGQNWWCVLFPPLCFVDVAVKKVPEKDKILLKNILTEEEYNIVSEAQDEKNIPIKIKFKIVELWQKRNKN